MGWQPLAAALALQFAADLLRLRAWLHVVRDAVPGGVRVRYRDVLTAHLGGCGWNGVAPAHAGDAVKVALLHRRLRSAPAATLAGTVVPPSLVEAGFTATLLAVVLATGSLAPGDLAAAVPGSLRVPLLIGAVACLIGALALRGRGRGRALVNDVVAGAAVIRRPRMLLTRVLPWAAAARIVRLAAIAFLLAAAGLPVAVGPALLLMAVQGATPSVGPVSSPARIAIVAAALPASFGGGATRVHVAQVLLAVNAATLLANLAVSSVVVGVTLRTVSPRRVTRWLRSARSHVPAVPDGAAATPEAAPAPGSPA